MPGGIRKINTPAWIRSSRCGAGNCVELRHGKDHLAVRDSKNGDSALLMFNRASWSTFLRNYRSA